MMPPYSAPSYTYDKFSTPRLKERPPFVFPKQEVPKVLTITMLDRIRQRGCNNAIFQRPHNEIVTTTISSTSQLGAELHAGKPSGCQTKDVTMSNTSHDVSSLKHDLETVYDNLKKLSVYSKNTR